MFNPDIIEHHPTLYLNMDGNSTLYCDSDLCWLKEAEKFGSLSLYGVRCVPSVDFQHVELNCTLGKHCLLFLVSCVSPGFIYFLGLNYPHIENVPEEHLCSNTMKVRKSQYFHCVFH